MIGIANTSARAGGPQWRPSSSRSTSSPSEIRVRISASSISSTHALVADVDADDVELGEHDAEHDREHRRREHRAADQSRERRGDREQRRRRSAALRRSRGPSAHVPVDVAATALAGGLGAGRRERAEVGDRVGAEQAAGERRVVDRRRDRRPAPRPRPRSGRRARTEPCRGSRGWPGRVKSSRSASSVSVTGRVASYWSERSQTPVGSSSVDGRRLAALDRGSRPRGRLGDHRRRGERRRPAAGARAGSRPARPGSAPVSAGRRPSGDRPFSQSS